MMLDYNSCKGIGRSQSDAGCLQRCGIEGQLPILAMQAASYTGSLEASWDQETERKTSTIRSRRSRRSRIQMYQPCRAPERTVKWIRSHNFKAQNGKEVMICHDAGDWTSASSGQLDGKHADCAGVCPRSPTASAADLGVAWTAATTPCSPPQSRAK